MKTELLDAVVSKNLKEKTAHFEVGDIVDVHCRIKEGDKQRIQVFGQGEIMRLLHVGAQSFAGFDTFAKVARCNTVADTAVDFVAHHIDGEIKVVLVRGREWDVWQVRAMLEEREIRARPIEESLLESAVPQ